MFPQNYVPFKPVLDSTSVEVQYEIAAQYYAQAYKTGFLDSPPFAIVVVTVGPGCLEDSLFNGSIEIKPRHNTIAFKTKVTLENDPGCKCTVHPFENRETMLHMLDVGQRALKEANETYITKRRLTYVHESKDSGDSTAKTS